MVGDGALAVIHRAGEQHRPKRGAVLAVLKDLQGFVPPLRDRGLIAPDGLRVGAFAVHEVRVLTEQLVHGVAGQVDERLVGKDDGVAGQGGIGHEHRHAGPPDGLDEQATLLPHGFDVPFGDGSLRGVRLVLVKLVHGQSDPMRLWTNKRPRFGGLFHSAFREAQSNNS